MNFLRNSILTVMGLALCALSAQAAETLRISSTIGPVDAGMLPLLADTFSQKTGIAITIEKAGTGATLKKAESGNFDLVMVHARKLEDAFCAAGFGIDRRDVMYNDFVILGPKADPAGIKGMKSVTEAMAKLAAAKVHFVSRGDKSGTHVKEMDIWAAAGIQPSGSWYEVWEGGSKGNKATTLYAEEKQAYTLMDRATWLTLKDTISLVPLMEADPLMLNLIAVIRINPEKFPAIHKEEALKFADWVVGDEAQTIIRDFGKDKYGQPLFFPNSDQWNAKHKK
ncbi:MAG: substrate-binding domain-containing protein [Mailhella sp.]|nr:substrate-binding domain-containing protein [Mailhella sp.]